MITTSTYFKFSDQSAFSLHEGYILIVGFYLLIIGCLIVFILQLFEKHYKREVTCLILEWTASVGEIIYHPSEHQSCDVFKWHDLFNLLSLFGRTII